MFCVAQSDICMPNERITPDGSPVLIQHDVLVSQECTFASYSFYFQLNMLCGVWREGLSSDTRTCRHVT